MKHVILVCGKMRSGKDQFATYLAEEFEKQSKMVVFDKFAQDLKDFCKDDFQDFAKVINGMVDSLSASLSGFCSYHFSQDAERSVYNNLMKELVNFKISDHNWYEDKTPLTRSILQIMGTEVFRNRVDGQYWVKRLYERAVNVKMFDVVIVTDARFPNEVDAFTKEYLCHNDVKAHSIRVIRDTGIYDTHPSETALDDYDCFNYIVENTDTLERLRETAVAVVEDILKGENE